MGRGDVMESDESLENALITIIAKAYALHQTH